MRQRPDSQKQLWRHRAQIGAHLRAPNIDPDRSQIADLVTSGVEEFDHIFQPEEPQMCDVQKPRIMVGKFSRQEVQDNVAVGHIRQRDHEIAVWSEM